jgi:hypothetical protein
MIFYLGTSRLAEAGIRVPPHGRRKKEWDNGSTMNANAPRPHQRLRSPKQLQRALRSMLREALQLRAETEEMKKRATRVLREAARREAQGQ